jgi:cbb3-type cytochrome c oxidase subunit III
LYKEFFVAFVFLRAFVVPSVGAFVVPSAQEGGRTVADGVFTDAQAARGATAYEMACAGCHRADLGGGTGPALRDQRFAREFAGKDLKSLFTRVATTMPRNAPGSLGDNVSLDIVAHLLKENGFPAGPRELAADALDAVRVLPGRPKPPPPIGDFSYVEVVGCLAAGPKHTWLLTHASTPAVPAPASAAPPAGADVALGNETFLLVDAIAYAPQEHAGHKVSVRGLLIRMPGEQRLTISTLETVAPRCGE